MRSVFILNCNRSALLPYAAIKAATDRRNAGIWYSSSAAGIAYLTYALLSHST